ncbi:MAG: glycogen debranching enzyme, partial [bacterium]
DGSVLANPPLIERIAHDPILADTKLIAEAWDASGLYQVGSFPAWGRWAEWNGKFRDDVRKFVIGQPGMVPAIMKRLSGSPDLYQGSGRAPYHSINFVTSHDGFTLCDLVSYEKKHNEANGENNQDGSDLNFSWNCGFEGPTESIEINALRLRQMKNLATLNLLSHGVPMILAGDEFGRTQAGNNNAYCQDNEISWVNWQLAEQNAGLLRFFKLLIQFRKEHINLRRVSFENDRDTVEISWHAVGLEPVDTSHESRSVAMHIHGNHRDDDIYIIANAYWDALVFQLPRLRQQHWHRILDTSLPSPDDICDTKTLIRIPDSHSYQVCPRSVVVLITDR